MRSLTHFPCVDQLPGCIGPVSRDTPGCVDCDSVICDECAAWIDDQGMVALCSCCAYRRLLSRGPQLILARAERHYRELTDKRVAFARDRVADAAIYRYQVRTPEADEDLDQYIRDFAPLHAEQQNGLSVALVMSLATNVLLGRQPELAAEGWPLSTTRRLLNAVAMPRAERRRHA